MEKALSTLGVLRAKSSKDLAERSAKEYPADPAAYELLEDCGRGVSATVHRARCIPFNEEVAVKKMNLESLNVKLEDIIREAQTMKSYNHPSVLPLYTSFIVGQDLYMITPFCEGGSVLHIMKYKAKEGLDEVIIASIMKEVLEGLKYVHQNGGIHRDVKAGNILITKEGFVKLGDFGVAATADRAGSWGNEQSNRTTFVGTPCWMAPEVMEQTSYNASADIWSFGITMIELAHGHAPFAKFPPMKVLLMTLQRPPPELEQDGRKTFSKHMKEVVEMCLDKDPTKRPTAEKLLQHKFFKNVQGPEYLKKNLLAELPDLGNRVLEIRQGKAATSAAENDRQLQQSQEEYVKGVSGWNFDLKELKKQAAQEPDDSSTPATPIYQPSMDTIPEGPEDRDGENSASVSRRSTEEGAPSPQPDPAVAAAGVSRSSSSNNGAAATAQPLNGGLLQNSYAKVQRAQSAFVASGTVAAVTLAAGMSNGAAGGITLAQFHSDPNPTGSTALTGTVSGEPPSSNASSTSPGQSSPPMSREGSAHNTWAAAGASPAPPGTAGKEKKHGRFTLYEPGVVPPPMSPPASKAAAEAGPFGRPPTGITTVGSDAPRYSDSGETPRLAQQLGALEAACAELTAAAASGAGGAGSVVSGSGKPPTLTVGLGLSPSIGDSVDSFPGAEPEKRGRFKIIKEEGPASRSVSKVPSMIDLRSKSELKAVGPGLSPVGVLGKLLELHEQANQHQAALGRLIETMREGDAGTGSGSGQAQEVAASRKPSTTVGVTALSRTASAKVFVPYGDLQKASLQQLLKDNDNVTEVAEKLLERAKELERKVAELTEENTQLKTRSPDGGQQLADVSDSGTSSQYTSRHASSTNLAVAAGAAAAATVAMGSAPTGPVSSSSAAGSVAVSPVASPRTQPMPRGCGTS